MNKVIWAIVAILLIGGLVWLIRTPGKPGRLDAFASCISESGAKYFGAFWCPNCKNQEAMFGRSARLLPRTECSTPDGRGQLQVCADAKIEGYPTWDMPDGTRVTGVQTLEALSQATSCPLPEDNV